MKCLMIHIPRTAGTSMKKYAARHADNFQDLGSRRNSGTVLNKDSDFVTLGHRGAFHMIKSGRLTQSYFDSSFKFAFVRNTWDRLISLYEHLRSFRFRKTRSWNEYLYSFPEFVDLVTSGTNLVRKVGRYNTAIYSQANTQLAWLEWGVDFIGRFESLDRDWEHVCRTIGMKYTKLGRYNKRKRKKDIVYYDRKSIQLVADFYADEIEYFRFKFEGSQK